MRIALTIMLALAAPSAQAAKLGKDEAIQLCRQEAVRNLNAKGAIRIDDARSLRARRNGAGWRVYGAFDAPGAFDSMALLTCDARPERIRVFLEESAPDR